MNKSKFVIPEFKDLTAERSHRIEDMRQKVQQLELLRSGMKDLEDNNNRLEPMIAQAEKTLAAKRESLDLIKKSKLVQETGAQFKPKMQMIASSCKAHTSRMSQITVKCGEISMIETKLAEKQTLFKRKMAETRSSLIDRRNQITRQRTEILRDFKTNSDAKKQQISEIQSRITSAKLELESHGGAFASLDKRLFLLGAEKAVLEQDGNVLADNLIVRTEYYQTMEKNKVDLKEKIRVSNEMLLQAEMEKSNLEVRKQSLIEETGHMETQKLQKYSLQNLIEESKVEFEKLKQSILERESVNCDLIEQLKQLNNECNAKSAELNEVVKEFAGVKNECELAEVKHVELYSELEQEQRNTATLESEMEILVKEKSNVVSEIERLNALKIENEKNGILLIQEEQRLEIEIPNIYQDIKNQQVICDELFTKVKSSENEIKMKIEQLNAIKLNHHDGVSALEAEHFVEMGNMNSKVEQMNDQIAIRINESSENSKTLTNKRSELARLEKDVENAEIELIKLEQLDETLGAEFEHLKKTNSDELELLKKINEPIIDEVQKEIENLNQYVKDKQRELDEKQDYETSCQELSLEIETIERKLEIAGDERDQLNEDIELGHFIQGHQNAVSIDPRDCVSHQKVVIGDSESDTTQATIGGRSPVGIRQRFRNIIPLVSASKVTTPIYAPPKTPNSGLNFQNLTLREKDDDDSSIMIIDEIKTPVAKNRPGAMKIDKNEIIKKTPTKTPIYGTLKLDFGLIRPTPKEQFVTTRNPPSKTPISPKSALKSPKSTKVSGSVKRVEFILPDAKEPIKPTPVLSTPLKSGSTVNELDIRTTPSGEMPTTSRVGSKSNTGMLMSRVMRETDKRKNNNKTPTVGGAIIKRLKPSSTFRKSTLNKSENNKSSTDFDDIFNLDLQWMDDLKLLIDMMKKVPSGFTKELLSDPMEMEKVMKQLRINVELYGKRRTREQTLLDHECIASGSYSILWSPLGNLVKYSHPSAQVKPGHIMPSDTLTNLLPIHLKVLQPGTTHPGRLLRGQLIVDPIPHVSVQSIIEDELGDVSMISFYDVGPGETNDRNVLEMFKRGTKMAICEPFFKLQRDGQFGIRVDNFNDVAFVDRVGPFIGDDVIAWKDEGKRHFVAEQFTEAARCFHISLSKYDSNVLAAVLCSISLFICTLDSSSICRGCDQCRSCKFQGDLSCC